MTFRKIPSANHWKQWDAKPGASGKPTLDRLHGKPAETLRRKTRGCGIATTSPVILCSFGYRTPFASE